jgi:hypothetical protein
MKRFDHLRCGCVRADRRAFLADLGMGFTGLALGAMLQADRPAAGNDDVWSPPDGRPHFAPRAKSVIWIFLSGGYSHLETFDPKPALNTYAGKTFAETPYPDPLQSPLHDKRSRAVLTVVRDKYSKIFPLQVGFQKRGQSGIEITDWWPHLSRCVDDIAFVRNMYTTDNDHAAENQIHTGRHRLDETQPSLGAWAHYGLGTLNENLPTFITLGGPTRADTRESLHAYYLGPEHDGVPLSTSPTDPLPFGVRSGDILEQEQRNEFALIDQLNRLSAVEYPRDEAVAARIRAYELAFRMQTSVPEALDLGNETAETYSLYGLDNDATKAAGQRLLVARRMVERGVRFVQVYPTPYGTWDSHQKLQANHARLCNEVDQPVAALLTDLKRRGMMDQTVVVFCTEFGRTPAVEERGGGTDGRDHHPHGFTIWMAGAGIRGGTVHGATDELGFHAIEPGHYVTDLHATVLHLLGLDPRRLEVPGRKRLEIDRGQVIREILA